MSLQISEAFLKLSPSSPIDLLVNFFLNAESYNVQLMLAAANRLPTGLFL